MGSDGFQADEKKLTEEEEEALGSHNRSECCGEERQLPVRAWADGRDQCHRRRGHRFLLWESFGPTPTLAMLTSLVFGPTATEENQTASLFARKREEDKIVKRQREQGGRIVLQR